MNAKYAALLSTILGAASLHPDHDKGGKLAQAALSALHAPPATSADGKVKVASIYAEAA